MTKANKEKDAFFYERIQAGFYVASPDGTIRNRFGKKLGTLNKRNVIVIGLKNPHGKMWNYLAHRLVWAYFHGPIPEGFHPVHEDHNTSNNTITNLKLKSEKEIQHRNGDRVKFCPRVKPTIVTKLNEEIVAEARQLHATGDHSVNSLSKRYGVSKQTMNSAITGETWKHVDTPVSTIVFLRKNKTKIIKKTKSVHKYNIVRVLTEKSTKMSPEHIRSLTEKFCEYRRRKFS